MEGGRGRYGEGGTEREGRRGREGEGGRESRRKGRGKGREGGARIEWELEKKKTLI